MYSQQYYNEDSNTSSDDEDMNEVIKNNYKRNHILKYDFLCNSHLRKQLRNIKKEDIKKKEQCKKKNIFIDLINDPLEDIKKEKRLNRKDYDDIKFEVPYTIICKKCNKYIYKGERFKSERRKIGFYINSTFYSFCIVCKNCLNEIVFETNPQNCSYDIIQGARQKNEKYENILTHKGKKNINSINFEDNKKKKINPFLLLEQNVVQNKKKGLSDCTTFENYNQSKHIITNNNKEDIFEEGKENDQKYDYDKNSVENDTYPLSQHNKNILITYKKNECEQRDNNSVVSNEEFNIISPQKNDEDSNTSSDDEDMNEVIKNNYKRNHILKYDFLKFVKFVKSEKFSAFLLSILNDEKNIYDSPYYVKRNAQYGINKKQLVPKGKGFLQKIILKGEFLRNVNFYDLSILLASHSDTLKELYINGLNDVKLCFLY
ncbi:hypothetical protein PFTANZ_03961 [Plasmodium falciparum Tanzania (2000708)]|uniref:Splicing factor YJU2 n=1 Tax=Plasmodium falciparum Tanzania (2000708) TaxID=1036725 RepID=A0A024W452_PLAFA|nr:hypothetical protein PFTANZ_03961 [Plasmodium falciparum Tanzania (2000708)]